jgi:hypothetical protein
VLASALVNSQFPLTHFETTRLVSLSVAMVAIDCSMLTNSTSGGVDLTTVPKTTQTKKDSSTSGTSLSLLAVALKREVIVLKLKEKEKTITRHNDGDVRL